MISVERWPGMISNDRPAARIRNPPPRHR